MLLSVLDLLDIVIFLGCNGASGVGGGKEVKRGKESGGWGGVDWVFSPLLGKAS